MAHDLFEAGGISTLATAKSLGAFYTDAQVAEFLVRWAVRGSADLVLDPSFGGGVFLRSACKRVKALGGQPSIQVFGVELDPRAHARIAEELRDEFGVVRRNLILSSFFEIDASQMPAFDAVVGNPPFIRYQRFSGAARRLALCRASEAGVRLSRLASSWAPFLIHSIALLKDGGRLAMVLPWEIGCASYARPVIEHVARSFAKVVLLTFRTRLFPDLNETTMLLLAEDKGVGRGRLYLLDLPHSAALAGLQDGPVDDDFGATPVDAHALTTGQEKFVELYLPERARDLYRRLKSSPVSQRLGSIAQVGIGYVTGANDFFHLGEKEAAGRHIPPDFLKAAIRRGRGLRGLRYTREDWRGGLESGEAAFLLHINGEQPLPPGVVEYLKRGRRLGVPKAFKCRSRRPWFRVPHVYLPDAFLTYMSGGRPRLVANEAGAVAPNTLHIVRLKEHASVGANELAALWRTSLTALSAEVEGHALGGGLLKLEPAEARSVVLPVCAGLRGQLPGLAHHLDVLIREGNLREANRLADRTILIDGLGLSTKECQLLAEAAQVLRVRRIPRR